uniref:Monodehydroascorbate reductase n=1 Tax=Tanacetum cinerariifolium TaxID=118510 RepID=A0A6L2JW28_TANCI|nr:hypothetical protein [Tanacetum cinerariifolium]
MSSFIAQQAKLVPKEKRLEIRKYVPEVYMHQFWDSVYKYDTFYRFKIDKRKRFKLNLEIFRDILKIFPRVQGQEFDALPTDEEIMSFLRELGHTGEINSLNDVVVDHMHQPWSIFAALINKSLSGKTTGLDKLCLFRAQILWGMYHQKNVDYVELLWKYFIYQIDNKAYKKQEKMYYPRFTKVIIYYFITQDKTLSWRNKIRMHTFRDDYLINTLRFVFAKEETQIYDAILPECLTSPEMKETQAYMTYLGFATGATPPKKAQKFKKLAFLKLTTVPVSTKEPTRKSKRIKRPTKKSTEASARGVVTKETPKMPLTKKEKVDVTRDKENKSDSEHGTDESELGSKSDHEENEDDEDDKEEVKDEFRKTSSNDSDDKAKDKGFVQEESIDAAMTNTEVSVTGSSHLSDMEAKFLNFSDISHTDAEIVSIMDVQVYHDVPSQQTPTLLIVPILVISDSLLVFSTFISHSLPSFTPPPQQSTSIPSTTKATNPLSSLPDFASALKTWFQTFGVLLKSHMINMHYGESHIGKNNVKVMRKNGCGYLQEILVRRADNDLYIFKEGDFPRLRINEIEDMLLLVVQNWLTNLSGDDISEFTIALRMFHQKLGYSEASRRSSTQSQKLSEEDQRHQARNY